MQGPESGGAATEEFPGGRRGEDGMVKREDREKGKKMPTVRERRAKLERVRGRSKLRKTSRGGPVDNKLRTGEENKVWAE